MDELLTTERQQVKDLYESGRTVRDIARTLNVSTQRVYQQLKNLELTAPTKVSSPGRVEDQVARQ